MSEICTYTVNVRQMVEFILRHGDIRPGDGTASPERMQLGAQIHRKLQKERAGRIEGYRSEVSLSDTIVQETVRLEISGRCDGCYTAGGVLYVEEFKTVEHDLQMIREADILHTAQGLCYAYMLLKDLPKTYEINLSVVYYTIHDEEEKAFVSLYTRAEAERFFQELAQAYLKWILADHQRQSTLRPALQALRFPFPEYRQGQRQLSVAVYKTITQERGKLFAQAPTGIGKTISVLFPALKAYGEAQCGKIFYLTARNAGAAPPCDALNLLSEQCPDLIYVSLTAKEKICPGGRICDPSLCSRAAGHYDRINAALRNGLTEGRCFRRNDILTLAEAYRVCPFELSLDLALWADVIIGDYNYLFHPAARLKRFFQYLQSDYVFLIDEAHNLPDRVREMFTARLPKRAFLQMQRELKALPAAGQAAKAAKAVNQYFIDRRKNCEVLPYLLREQDLALSGLAAAFCEEAGKVLNEINLPETLYEQLLTLYFETLFYLKISELYDEKYRAYFDGKEDFSVTLYCADPSEIIKSVCERGKAAIFFSGTLQPIEFFFRALGGDPIQDRQLRIPSPFPPENRLVITAADVATTYKKRQFFYDRIADYITALTKFSRGNFMVFFSSYHYLNQVYALLPETVRESAVFIQPNSTDPAEREAFLADFQEHPKCVRIGLCVLGGIYAEGIDLAGSRLSGVIVVGVGLPMVCTERELIRMVYEEQAEGSGFANAYVYPGMNKVLQAAGRVIRDSADRGFVVLLDERYRQQAYREILPPDWTVRSCRNIEESLNLLFDFNWEI